MKFKFQLYYTKKYIIIKILIFYGTHNFKLYIKISKGDNMNINFEYYKVFYYVAKNKNITKTANDLMISQPAISKTIKILEEQIGCSLFTRNKSGVFLTEEG